MTVSTVAVGGDADRSLLEMISDLGGGRFHQTNDPNNIPQIFVQETSTVARTNLVEEPFRPVVTGRSQALRGIDWGSTFLLGYVQTRQRRVRACCWRRSPATLSSRDGGSASGTSRCGQAT